MNIVGDVLSTVVLSQDKRIDWIFPDVVIEEQHTDELVVTEHPVEQGAQITDHAYKSPAKLVMTVGWSDSSIYSDGRILYPVVGGIEIPDIATAYSALLSLQESRQPIDVITNKRAYSNMLIRSISVVTDPATYNVLRAVVTFQQIIVVQTSSVKIVSKNQAKPQRTGAVINTGTKQPIPVTVNSIVNDVLSVFK